MKKYLLVYVLLQASMLSGQHTNYLIDSRGNRQVFNKKGELVEYRILDEGQEISTGINLSRTKYNYDSKGRLLSEIYYDGNGEPFEYKFGVAKIVYEYDSISGGSIKNFYNKHNKITIDNRIGASKVESFFNAKGQLIKINYYDTTGWLKSWGNRGASINFKYNSEGKIIEEVHFDENGKIFKILNEISTYHSSIRWNPSSMPDWLKMDSNQINHSAENLDGKFIYELILDGNGFEGSLQFQVSIKQDDLKLNKFNMDYNINVPKYLCNKVEDSLKSASFIALGNFPVRPEISGVILFSFKR